MEIHAYHDYFLPILIKLAQGGQTTELIDVTECFTGTPEQNYAVFKALNQSEYAKVKKVPRFILQYEEIKPQRYLAMILPLGFEYIKFCREEFEKLTKKSKPVGFQLPKKAVASKKNN
ncbi:MAG: hypothetical protein JXB49_17710 [Bacteroidales bacterium]|nr:hypothetical protein [Bacteroidales bacterium]